jgi:hypothetical protein
LTPKEKLLKIYLDKLREDNLYPLFSKSSALIELTPTPNNHGFSLS